MALCLALKKEKELKQEQKNHCIPFEQWAYFYYFPTMDIMRALYKNKSYFNISSFFVLKNRKKYIYPDLFFQWLNKNPKLIENLKKIDNNNIPVSYKKVYSIFQYDKVKYAGIYIKLQRLSLKYDYRIVERARKSKILKLCYVKDEQGQNIKLGDEIHIFRYAVYHRILNEIAQYLIVAYELQESKDVLNYLTKRTNIVIYNTEADEPEEKEEKRDVICAELKDLINKPFYIRFIAHCRLLKGLYKGLEIEEAVEEARKILV